jgi:hypothetical protein
MIYLGRGFQHDQFAPDRLGQVMPKAFDGLKIPERFQARVFEGADQGCMITRQTLHVNHERGHCQSVTA